MEIVEKKNILLAEEDSETLFFIESAVGSNCNIAGRAKNGRELLTMALDLNPDLIIMDVVLSELDGFMVLEEMKKSKLKTKVIIHTALSSQAFVQKAMKLGVEYYLLKPVQKEVIEARIQEILFSNGEADAVKSKKGLDEKISNIFITVGIPAHIKGYYFLREAVKMAVANPNIINSITKILYPSIAERFETSASKVERAIRHAIEVAWNRGKIDKINNIFGIDIYVNNEKPTNGEFIALVADKMLLEA